MTEQAETIEELRELVNRCQPQDIREFFVRYDGKKLDYGAAQNKAARGTQRFMLLAKVIDGAVFLRGLKGIDPAHLSQLAEVAADEGFHLMFECDSPPDMAEVARRVPEGTVSGMDCVRRLWDLRK